MISIIITILFIFIIICIGYIVYLKYIRKYTRERFAFTGVTLIGALFSSWALQLYASESFVSAAINTSNIIFSTKIAQYQTDTKDHLLMLVGIALIMSFVYKIHKNWDGPISQNLHERRRFNETLGLLDEAIIQLGDFFSRESKIIPFTAKKSNTYQSVFIESEDERMPWYENVFELLTYADHQYKIDLTRDYYRNKKCFISKYGNSGSYVAILCTIDFPKESSIKSFVQFAKGQKHSYTEYIVAVKKSNYEVKVLEYGGVSITVLNEQEMLDSLIDFSSYQDFIDSRFNKREISQGGTVTIKDIYVPLNGKKKNQEEIGDVLDYVGGWLHEKSNKHLAILGEYGCGKSVISLKITCEFFKRIRETGRVPILIELRGKSPRNLDPLGILSTWGASHRLDASSLMKLHKAGKLLIIFEGFDEMDMVGDMEMRLSHFQKLWQFATPKSKIIITGRPNFFLDDEELKTNLGVEKLYETSHYCEPIYLEKFNVEQIKLALRSVDEITRSQVLQILSTQHNSNFFDLVCRPSILYLVSVIWKERKLSKIKDNINSAVVISEFIKYSYARQSEKKVRFPLTEKEREYFMIGIAVGMLHQTGFSNQIYKVDLENVILKLYRGFPEDIDSHRNATQPKRKKLKERMRDNKHAEETVLSDVRSCGILVNELTRNNHFKFAHKSFFEYQVSLYFVESILQNKGEYNIMMNAIANSLEVSLASYKHSKETMSFISDILISKLNLVKSDDPVKVANELFAILHPNKIFGAYPKFVAYFDMIFSSRRNLLFLMFSSSVLFLLGTYIFESYVALNLMTSFGVFYAIQNVLFFVNIRSNWRKRRLIWLRCCEQLSISHIEISKVVPSKYIRFIEDERTNLIFGDLMKWIDSLTEKNEKKKVLGKKNR